MDGAAANRRRVARVVCGRAVLLRDWRHTRVARPSRADWWIAPRPAKSPPPPRPVPELQLRPPRDAGAVSGMRALQLLIVRKVMQVRPARHIVPHAKTRMSRGAGAPPLH